MHRTVFVLAQLSLIVGAFSFQVNRINCGQIVCGNRCKIASASKSIGICLRSASKFGVIKPLDSQIHRSQKFRSLLQMTAVLEGEASASAPTPSGPAANGVKYLSQDEAKQLETDLTSDEGGFSPLSLMEVAGQGLADAIYNAYSKEKLANQKIVLICGKHNNGGAALVAARHLHLYGYEVEVVYPERPPKEPFLGLGKQLKNFDIRVNMGMPGTSNRIGLIVDAICDHSFEGNLKAPWDLILKQLNSPDYFAGIPILSVDVPAGWDVNKGPPKGDRYIADPDILVSFFAPKLCSLRFDGVHFLAGRLVSSRMTYKNKLKNPPYEFAKAFADMPLAPPFEEGDDEEEEDAAFITGTPENIALNPLNPLLSLNAMVSDVPPILSSPSPSPATAAAAAAAAAMIPGSFEPDPQIQGAIKAATDQAMGILNQQGEGWPAEVRKVVSPRLVPLGWSSNWLADRTSVAKVCFLTAKALSDARQDNLDVLAEGRALAESAFEEQSDLMAGQLLRGFAKLYKRAGNDDACQLVLENVDRVVAERGLPADLKPPPPKPEYGYADKWTVTLRGPGAGVAGEVDVVVRPVQQARLLLLAWARTAGVAEAELGRYGLVVPPSATAWRCGPVPLDSPIGESGLVNLAQVDIVELPPPGPASA